MKYLRKLAIWFIFHGPYIGRLAIPLFEFGINKKGIKKK